LADSVKKTVDAFRKSPTKNNLNAAKAALAKLNTENRKAMYGYSEYNKAMRAVADREKAIAEAKKKSVKKVTVNARTVSAKTLKTAVTKAGGSSKYVTTVVLGKNVKKISKYTFKNYGKVKTLVVRTKKLKKATVRKSLAGSKITKVKVKVGKKKANRKYVKKYRKIFTKKNAGKKVKVSQ
jgi:hypothetical protein